MPSDAGPGNSSQARGPFRRIASAGIFFQGGAAALDPNTILAALVFGMTGSTAAVGAAAAITRYGWLFPQIFVAYAAARRRHRMPFYAVGAFGRAACLLGIAILLWFATAIPGAVVVVAFFAMWTAYGFVSGIVAVPYNDIVGRTIPSHFRSRMLAVRFFGGGVLALAVAAAAHQILTRLDFYSGYGTMVFIAAVVMAVSAACFVSVREPAAPVPERPDTGFAAFLRDGVTVLREDRDFRMFVYVQWLAGVVSMALPFYILQVPPDQAPAGFVAILLGAHTLGALLSNPLWGWWGDKRGKRSLLALVSRLNAVAPAATLVWIAWGGGVPALAWFVVVFFILGAVGNGRTIAYLGYLMEISPDDRRPAYSGYFNALVAPAALLPIAAAGIAAAASFAAVFATALIAALLQIAALRYLKAPAGGRER
jgi:MFS family permease